jgi:cytochrome b
MTSPTKSTILVWDLPLRIFHWTLAGSFAVAFVTAESERWRDMHALAGYTAIALVAFRLLWGFVGPRHARFASFRFSPRRAVDYLRSLVFGRAAHFAGHNPAGAIAIYAMLAAIAVVVATGIVALDEGRVMGEIHEGAANLMLALVAVHVVGVIVGSLAHRENLAKSMLTGYKSGEARDAIRGPHVTVAIALVAFVVALWSGALPLPGTDGAVAAEARTAPAHHQHSDRSRSDAHPGG